MQAKQSTCGLIEEEPYPEKGGRDFCKNVMSNIKRILEAVQSYGDKRVIFKTIPKVEQDMREATGEARTKSYVTFCNEPYVDVPVLADQQ